MTAYFYLGLMAVIFSTFGFLLRVFYFGGKRDAHAGDEAEEMRQLIEQRQNALRDAQDELSRMNSEVRTLEQQVRLKGDEMETLRLLASRQDEEIRLLQQEAENIRAAVSASASGEHAYPLQSTSQAKIPDRDREPQIAGRIAPPRLPPPPAGEFQGEAAPPRNPPAALPVQAAVKRGLQGEVPTAEEASASERAKGTGGASWKENLSNILNILDEMEKEVHK